MNRRDHRFLGLLLSMLLILGAALGARAASTTAPARDVLAESNAEAYWIARMSSPRADNAPGSPPATQPVRSIVQLRLINGDPKWKQIATYNSARLISIAGREGQLAALLEGGDWMLIWDGGSSSGSLPADHSSLLMLAGSSESLWAIVSASGQAPPSTRPTTSSTSAPASTQPVIFPKGTKLLCRLDHGLWNLAAPLPPSASGARELSLVISHGDPYLAMLLDDAEARIDHWNATSGQWESLGAVRVDPTVRRIKLLSGLDRLWLWASDGTSPGWIFSHDGKRWSEPVALSPAASDGKPLAAFRSIDATIAGQNIRLVAMLDENKLQEFAFSPDGTPRGRADLPSPAIESDNQHDWTSALVAAVLMVILLNSVRRRGSMPSIDAVEAAGFRIAPNGLRFLAGAIDALPVIGTLIIVIYRLEPQDATPAAISEAMFLPLQIATAVYILLTGASEWMWGRTIGKQLCHLRVVTITGGVPTTRALLLRNLLRVIDVTMAGLPLLIVFISPLRQRVGDIAAETLVVVDAKKPAE